MNLDIKDLITLSDNNEYVVCSKTRYQDNNYFYLIDINNNTNFKLCVEKPKDDKVTFVEITDQNLIRQLLPLLFENAKHILDEQGA